jgi:hypothetical protein
MLELRSNRALVRRRETRPWGAFTRRSLGSIRSDRRIGAAVVVVAAAALSGLAVAPLRGRSVRLNSRVFEAVARRGSSGGRRATSTTPR